MSESELPTPEEIALLPRWAVVAFASRCARRALLLYLRGWPDGPAKYLYALAHAVELSELVAGGSDSHDATADTLVAAANDALDAHAFALLFRSAHPASIDLGVENAALAAHDAALAAHYALDVAAADKARSAAASAANHCAGASCAIAVIVRDYRTLRKRALAEGWTDITFILPEVLGPLWPTDLTQQIAIIPNGQAHEGSLSDVSGDKKSLLGDGTAIPTRPTPADEKPTAPPSRWRAFLRAAGSVLNVFATPQFYTRESAHAAVGRAWRKTATNFRTALHNTPPLE